MESKFKGPIFVLIVAVIGIGLFVLFGNGNNKELISADYEVATVTEADVLTIKVGDTYREIIKKLGKTKKIGTTKYIAQYIVGGDYINLVFEDYDEESAINGEGILARSRPITGVNPLFRGKITSFEKDGDNTIITLDTRGFTMELHRFNEAIVTVNSETIITSRLENASSELKVGLLVEIRLLDEIDSELEPDPIEGFANRLVIIDDESVKTIEVE